MTAAKKNQIAGLVRFHKEQRREADKLLKRLLSERGDVMRQGRPIICPRRHPELHRLGKSLRSVAPGRRTFSWHGIPLELRGGLASLVAVEPGTGLALVRVLDL